PDLGVPWPLLIRHHRRARHGDGLVRARRVRRRVEQEGLAHAASRGCHDLAIHLANGMGIFAIIAGAALRACCFVPAWSRDVKRSAWPLNASPGRCFGFPGGYQPAPIVGTLTPVEVTLAVGHDRPVASNRHDGTFVAL